MNLGGFSLKDSLQRGIKAAELWSGHSFTKPLHGLLGARVSDCL